MQTDNGEAPFGECRFIQSTMRAELLRRSDQKCEAFLSTCGNRWLVSE